METAVYIIVLTSHYYDSTGQAVTVTFTQRVITDICYTTLDELDEEEVFSLTD